MGKERNIRLLTCCLALTLLCGCGAFQEEASGEQELPQLVIGSDNYEPYSYLDSDGDFAGVDVELAQEACRRLGYQPVFRQIIWEDKDEDLSTGQVDCLWGSFTMTGREDRYEWAGPYLYSRQVVVVRANSSIRTLADLEGCRVAVQATAKPESVLLERSDNRIPVVGAVYCFSSMNEIYACLRKDYADAIAGHESALNTFLQTAPGAYRMLEENLYISQLGVAFEKGTHQELAAQLTQTLHEMREDGSARTIVEKYGLDSRQALEGEP